MRRILAVSALAAVIALMVPAPAQAIIHEIVASHCAAQENHDKTVDPPGQLNTTGNSFARALQASGVYTFVEGEDQAGVVGLNLETGEFGPLPAPPPGELAVSVLVDPERPNAKLGDEFIWVYFRDTELFDEPVNIYVQIYDLEHPAFENCPQLHHNG